MGGVDGTGGFNPRSLHRERRVALKDGLVLHRFNPRSLHRERLKIDLADILDDEFQSTLPT